MDTSLGKMIGLAVAHSSWPPWRLGRFWLELLGPTGNDLPPIVSIVDLLAWLHELDVDFRYRPTIRLLEVLKRFLIVPTQEILISDGHQGFLAAQTQFVIPAQLSLLSILSRPWFSASWPHCRADWRPWRHGCSYFPFESV